MLQPAGALSGGVDDRRRNGLFSRGQSRESRVPY